MSNTLLKILTGIAFLGLCLICTLAHKSKIEQHFKEKLQAAFQQKSQNITSARLDGMVATLLVSHEAKYNPIEIAQTIAETLPWIHKIKYSFFSIPGKGDKKMIQDSAATVLPKISKESTKESTKESANSTTKPLDKSPNSLQITLNEFLDKPLLFEPESSQIDKSSYQQLKGIIENLNQNQQAKIEIQGHTNDIGPDDENLQLSKDRASSVKKYLMDNGLKLAERIGTKGYGESKPLCTAKTIDCRSKNRRVVFIVQ